MADGSKKNIEDVREGEMVLSYDVETESYVSREVVFFDDAHKVGSEGHVEACAKLGNPPSLYTINDLIEFTPEHPFYVRENGETKWAALVPDMRQHPQKGDPEELKLKIGQEILINGKWVKIEKLGVSRENVPDTKVYNLIIEGTSTYIANDIVVHNKCCFLGGTQITMADDSMKNIEDVKIGDMVRSFDEKTGELVNREVLALQNPIREGYYNLHFGDNQLIQVTSEHPFYAKKQDGSVQWCSIEPEKTVEYYPHLTFVGQLEIGDFIYTDQEEWTEVKSWDWVEGPVQTYNLWNIEGTCTFFANGLLVHNRDGTTTTSVTTTTTIPPEDCDSDGDEDGDGDTNCEDSDCWGQPGPAGIICCDNPSHCAYNRGCVDECINNKCLYQIRGVCDDTECIGLPCCNGVSQDCLDPDDDQSICVNCQGEIWDPIKASSPRCCGDDPPGGPDENWCTLGGGSCIDGLWTDDHCDDFVKNCDEGDPWGLNLPDCGGVDCDECCRNCDCVDVSISQKIFTKTLVENYADVFLKNSDPSYRDLDVEVYLNNSEDLDNCFDKGCDPWEYHFEDELGNYLGHEYTTPIHLNNGEIKKIYFVFTPSGPTPVDKYIIQIGVRDVGTTGCP